MMEFKYTGICFTTLRAWMCHEVSKNINPSILSISLVINPDSFNLAFFVFLVLPFRSFRRADFTHRMPFSKKLTFPWEVFNWLGRWTTLCTHFHFHVSTPLAAGRIRSTAAPTALRFAVTRPKPSSVSFWRRIFGERSSWLPAA